MSHSLFAHLVCSVWHIDRTISGSITLGQNEPGSNSNEDVLHIPQISKTIDLSSVSLMLYPEQVPVLDICGECWTLHCHYSQVHWPGVVLPVRVSSMAQIDLLKNYSNSVGLNAKKTLLWTFMRKCKYECLIWFLYLIAYQPSWVI